MSQLWVSHAMEAIRERAPHQHHCFEGADEGLCFQFLVVLRTSFLHDQGWRGLGLAKNKELHELVMRQCHLAFRLLHRQGRLFHFSASAVLAKAAFASGDVPHLSALLARREPSRPGRDPSISRQRCV